LPKRARRPGADALKSKSRSSSEVQPQAAPEPVVYVVDDDISVRESLGNLMRSVGLNVELFASALEFRNYPRPEVPCCLVLDVRLPGLSGLDLQREMSDLHDKTPIIFITGHGDVPMSVRAMKAGAVEFLQKPFREQDLLDAIHSALSKSAGGGIADTASGKSAAQLDGGGAESTARSAAGGATPTMVTELNPRQALARNIQIGRAIFSWSQEELGGRCGLHRSHISALEREELSVGVDAIDSIAAAFGIASHVILMPPGEAQAVLLESFNGVYKKPPNARRSIKT
jgi:DNA-binding response OmpR family regulator